MTADFERGARLGLVRRLLAAFEGKDLPVPAFAARLGKDKKAGYRWERGEDRPREATVDKIVEMCLEVGLPITAEWIERGRGGTAALGDIRIPESALAPQSAESSPARQPSRPEDVRARGKLRTTTKPPQKKKAS